jgi:hypothetical protein
MVELTRVPPVEPRSFASRAVAVVAVISHGDRVEVQDGAGVFRRMFAVALCEDVNALHAPGLAHIELGRQVSGFHKLVAAPTPFARLVAELCRDGLVVLDEVKQPDIVADVLGENPGASLRIAVGPARVGARQR